MIERVELQTTKPSLNIDVQNALLDPGKGLAEEQLKLWANLAYTQVKAFDADVIKEGGVQDVTIRLVEEHEITQLNRDYRGKDKPTNVLSFVFENEFAQMIQQSDDSSDEYDVNLLGDVVICHSVIVEEAEAQSKPVANHYAHMVVHGILHLCGYDHLDEVSAKQMEALEIAILAQKQIANPYL